MADEEEESSILEKLGDELRQLARSVVTKMTTDSMMHLKTSSAKSFENKRNDYAYAHLNLEFGERQKIRKLLQGATKENLENDVIRHLASLECEKPGSLKLIAKMDEDEAWEFVTETLNHDVLSQKGKRAMAFMAKNGLFGKNNAPEQLVRGAANQVSKFADWLEERNRKKEMNVFARVWEFCKKFNPRKKKKVRRPIPPNEEG